MPANPPDIFQAAVQHHQAGRVAEAEKIYRQIISANPNHADSIHLLGVVAYQSGNATEAIRLIERAVALDPNRAEYLANLGLILSAAGRHADAIAALNRAAVLRPNYPEAHNNLGTVLAAGKQFDKAIKHYEIAIGLRPDYAEAMNNLAMVHLESGRRDLAIAAYRKAIAVRPDFPEALCNLGNTLREAGKLDEAIAMLQQAIIKRPKFPQAFYNLGLALRDKQQIAESIVAYRNAIAADNNFAEAWNNLGNSLKDIGQREEAIAAYRKCIALKPSFPEAHANLAAALREEGWVDDAIESYQRALAQHPNFAEALVGLGTAFRQKNQMDESAAALQRAIQIRPNFAEAYAELGATLKEIGRLREAIAACRKGVELKNDLISADCNMMMMVHYSEDHDAAAIKQELQGWEKRHIAEPDGAVLPHENDRNPDRRIRIGYVSADFRDHVVGRNLLPLIQEHDQANFEIYCYSNVPRADDYTARFKAAADQWREIRGVGDEAAEKMIREDKIDLLIDLSGHTAYNRLPLFARKPAPVQATFGGYPGGTGLRAMDYHLGDPYLDPPGQTESHYVETIIRLADSFWCYDPEAMQLNPGPALQPLPATQNGFITFGCLNNLGKISDAALRLWGKALAAVEGSRMLMHSPEGSARKRIIELLGIDAGRIDFVGYQPRMNYMAFYSRIDLGLDSFPYCGHTTSLDSLWMGVPMVTLPGETASSRAGLSHLTNLGLTEFVAKDAENFVEIAVAFSKDLPRLAEIRAGLRDRLLRSVLTDRKKFARNLESAYRQMWKNYCGR
jgi:protein O-GlcNAc transferase